MTIWNDPSPTPTLLNRLRYLFTKQEETHDHVLRNGDGIRNLQLLLDLFRHPDISMEELAQKLEATLEEVTRSAMLMADGMTEMRSQLTTLQAKADRRDREIADLLRLVRSQNAALAALRTELNDLTYHLGLDPASHADTA